MSIKRIQQMTGFSYSTISRVINGKAKEFRISDSTREAIMEAAKEIKYRPNILAQSLRMKRTHTIGLIVPDIQNPFFGGLAWRIERRLREFGYSTILCNTNEIQENEEFYLKVMVDRQVDGIIIAPVHTREWPEMEDIRRKRSIVLIDRIFYDSDIPWVTSSNEEAAAEVTSAILRRGHARVAFLGGVPGTYVTTVRFKGYRNALEGHGIPYDDNVVFSEGYSPAAGEKMMGDLIARAPDIGAVFCVNNLVFLGAMKVIQQHEVLTGRSILMAAFDISPYCSIFKRPLICAGQDQQKLADGAVSLLLKGIQKHPIAHNHLTIPTAVSEHRLA